MSATVWTRLWKLSRRVHDIVTGQPSVTSQLCNVSPGEDRHQDLALANYHNQRLQTLQSRESSFLSSSSAPESLLGKNIFTACNHNLVKRLQNLSVNLISIELCLQTSKLLIKLSYQIDKSSCWCFLLPHIPLKSEVRALIVIRVGAVSRPARPPGSIFGLSVKILIVVYCSVKTKLWQEIERDWQTRPSQMILSTCTVTFRIWLK